MHGSPGYANNCQAGTSGRRALVKPGMPYRRPMDSESRGIETCQAGSTQGPLSSYGRSLGNGTDGMTTVNRVAYLRATAVTDSPNTERLRSVARLVRATNGVFQSTLEVGQ